MSRIQTTVTKKQENNHNNPPPLYKFYFEQQEKYSKIYGSKTIVFMQVGKFYEAYNTKTKGYPYLSKLEELLNIKFIRRDHIEKHKRDNKPNQFGINCVSISKNLGIMVENGYTIVLFDQKKHIRDDKYDEIEDNISNIRKDIVIERECIGVYSPGTFISDRQAEDANYLLSVYISEEKQLVGEKTLLAIGVTLVDVSTGNSIIHEFYSNKYDERFGLDELVRILQTFRPIEMIIYYHTINYDETTIKNLKLYLELDKYQHHHFYIYNNRKGNDNLNLLIEETFKINYQNNYLATIFEMNSQITLNQKKSPLEILRLERRSYATVSLMIVLKYISEHNVLLLKNLSYPDVYLYNKHLILGNNAIEQLNITSGNNLESYNNRLESLFQIINCTSTPMGKRFLKENLNNPLSQENRLLICERYDMIESLLNDNLYKKVQCELKNISDVERLHRRMAIGVITPLQFYRLDTFYQAITRIITIIKDNELLQKLLHKETIREFISIHIKYNKELNFEILQNYNNFSDIEKSFFKEGIHPNIDKLQNKIDYITSLIESFSQYFTDLILQKCKKIKNTDILDICSNEREGYYFTINKTNEKILKTELKAKGNLIKIDLSIGETIKIKQDDIIFKQQKGRTKIFVTPLLEHSTNLSQLKKRMSILIEKKFIKSMLDYYSQNKITMHKICKFVASLDFLVSGAIVASKYFYCKPVIPSEESIPSYLKTKALRHAIIERLCNETEYVPNDFELGNVPFSEENNIGKNDKIHGEKNGVILYGLNSSGKSSHMKAIGIAVILAQIGYYVPATEFIYEPYMALYARITGNDNILKGLSSFALEMTELDAILARTESQGPNTLVIGDEVCRGTEDTSGRAIVASALVSLSECKSSFIFSSHLHDIPTIPEVAKLTNLRIFHLRVEYDEENDCLIFDRKLMPGSGPSVYGLMIAKHLVKNIKFINRAEIIKKRLVGEDLVSLPTKKSNYNNDLLINKCCVCNYSPLKDYHKELESHHIHFQCNCLSDGKIKEKPYLSKNKLYNLVVLCRKCHVKVHQGEIVIRGYLDTSMGPILDYMLLDYTIDTSKKVKSQLAQVEQLEKKGIKSIKQKRIEHIHST